jgi:cystathionine beta-lyase
MAPSKTYNIPGLGCAFAVISEENLRKQFKKAMAGIVPGVNVLGYTAARAAYEYGADWQAALLEYLRGNRDLVAQAVGRMPNLSMATVESTYLAWIDVRRTGLKNPAGFFEESGVGLQDGIEFDGPGFMRLNFGCPRSLLDKALQRMTAALQSELGQMTDDG